MSGNELRSDVAAWVRNAEEDRGIALSVDRFRYPNGVCFHCQQCIEKYLKAVLTAHDEKPARIHDLVALGTECADYVPAIAEHYSDFVTLTAFAVMIRYPDGEADAEEAEEAVEAMEAARPVLRAALTLDEPVDADSNGRSHGMAAAPEADDNNTTTGATGAETT